MSQFCSSSTCISMCCFPYAENFEKMRYPTPDMATILAAISIAGRKGLKTSSVADKQVRDQVLRVSRETVAQKGHGRPPLKDKCKNKVELVPEKKHKFSATREGGFAPTSVQSPLRREANGNLRGSRRGQSEWSPES